MVIKTPVSTAYLTVLNLVNILNQEAENDIKDIQSLFIATDLEALKSIGKLRHFLDGKKSEIRSYKQFVSEGNENNVRKIFRDLLFDAKKYFIKSVSVSFGIQERTVERYKTNFSNIFKLNINLGEIKDTCIVLSFFSQGIDEVKSVEIDAKLDQIRWQLNLLKDKLKETKSILAEYSH